VVDAQESAHNDASLLDVELPELPEQPKIPMSYYWEAVVAIIRDVRRKESLSLK